MDEEGKKSKRGRKCKYDTVIAPNLKLIYEMYQYMDEKQIAQAFGIARSTWYEYKNKFADFSDTLALARVRLATELKSTLKMKALGYRIKETHIRVPEGDDGGFKDIYEKEIAPDFASIDRLLQNIDPTWRTEDAGNRENKEKLTEIAQQKADQSEWK